MQYHPMYVRQGILMLTYSCGLYGIYVAWIGRLSQAIQRDRRLRSWITAFDDELPSEGEFEVTSFLILQYSCHSNFTSILSDIFVNISCQETRCSSVVLRTVNS